MIGSYTKNGNGIKSNAELIVQMLIYKYRSKYVLLLNFSHISVPRIFAACKLILSNLINILWLIGTTDSSDQCH